MENFGQTVTTDLGICSRDVAIGNFLADYTAWMYGCGATCIRIKRNIERMSKTFGVETCVSIMPRHVELAVSFPGSVGQRLFVSQIRPCGINFTLNTDLSRLSWKVADNKLDIADTRHLFDHIVKEVSEGKRWIPLLASLANASFCRLFGGDATAMLVVFIATLIGFLLKTAMIRSGKDSRLTFICCAFVSSSICALASIFGWGDTPDVAMGTSVLYLIPGVPYISSASDLIDRHYLSAFSRFVDACVLTGCLSIGLIAAMMIFGINYF